jgi:hypothetical protein
MGITLAALRRYAVARSLFPPVTLKRAIDRMGFVQADPIRAPARAQDLILRHRVKNYRAGDLERVYAELGVEEDFFVVYGFVSRALEELMHPRTVRGAVAWVSKPWPPSRRKLAELLMAFVRERGAVHPRDADAHFALGSVKNYWGGSSNATTHLLEAMHYRGMLRVVRRDRGIRIYASRELGAEPVDTAARISRIDALVDAVVNVYAPLPASTLSPLVRRLRYAAPQWRKEFARSLKRAKERLKHARVDGLDWYWPANEDPGEFEPDSRVRFLAPFDPVVWDRARFELLWNWAYRFEAYTPAPRRKLGYYALPLLWHDRVIGWANLSVAEGKLLTDIGYVASDPPKDESFHAELQNEIERMRAFLRLTTSEPPASRRRRVSTLS